MALLKLPTPPAGRSNWSYQIELDGAGFTMTYYTNKRANGWHLDLFDASRAVLLRGIALVCGVDLLHSYRYRAVPRGKLYVIPTDRPATDPDLTAFVEGRAVVLYEEAGAE